MDTDDIDACYIDPIYDLDILVYTQLEKELPLLQIEMFLVANFALTIMRNGIHQYYVYYEKMHWPTLISGAKKLGGEELVELLEKSATYFLSGNKSDDDYNSLQRQIDPQELYNKVVAFISENRTEFKKLA